VDGSEHLIDIRGISRVELSSTPFYNHRERRDGVCNSMLTVSIYKFFKYVKSESRIVEEILLHDLIVVTN